MTGRESARVIPCPLDCGKTRKGHSGAGRLEKKTRNFDVDKEVLESFDIILDGYGAYFTPNDGGGMASKLDQAFK